MLNLRIFGIVITMLTLVLSCGKSPKTLREVSSFGDNWQFKLDNAPNSPWDTVSLPHTAKIEPLVVNDQWQGTATYKKDYEVKSLKGKKRFFYFEGVMQEAKVYINDSLVADHKGGYLPFTVDATNYLMQNAKNTITVKVINVDDATIPPGKALSVLDFNLFGGIYRNVYSIETNEIYITDAVAANKVNGGGLLVKFDTINKELASGFVKTHLRNDSDKERAIKLQVSLKDAEKNEVHTSITDLKIAANSDISHVEEIQVANPKLWSPNAPNLYKVEVSILEGETPIDFKIESIGIRNIKLTDTAFYLNGEKLFLNGTNRHQEYPYVGYALSDEAQYRDAYKIKEAGFNFVRLSHYPHAEAFMKACDELGLLVMNCIPGWQFIGGEEFVKNSVQDVKDLARRDRNHPSVIFWENSLNESGMTNEYMQLVNEVLEAELPYEDTYSAGWINDSSYDLFIPARQHAKPPFYWNNFEEKGRPIVIAEYGDWEYYAQNAGFNQKEFSDLKESERSSRQARNSGEKGLLQQALNYQEAFNSNLKGAQSIGHANWLMFDYNRGYSDDLETSGISDIFRIPKFSYYFYKSQKDIGMKEFGEPMVFIASYWTEESTPKIKVFSNAEEVALYLNDSLIARKKPTINSISEKLPHPPFEFDLSEFKSGQLKAIGYVGGKEVTTHKIITPEEAVKLELSADVKNIAISENHPDVVFVYAKITDKNGTLVPGATNRVLFKVKGNSAELIGENPVKAEAGIATILLRTTSKTGSIEINAESENLESTHLKI
ncbi:DUF4982 domain-containing protein [Gillisia sp. M10.2A]|uniref:DUF4982 domain-containing protein n=1 Tax=Gillisia lutea TaxID=2909668 RepID=A0ABS9EMA3_9FLAO|nr:glycoside hydrolase family 2 TIM barrel-domain containing protein [Gillisia lutea]MCF4102556.1 DUF4982 domain-containing protein [Gillisia lutea]